MIRGFFNKAFFLILFFFFVELAAMSESVTTDLPLELFQGLWNFYRLSRDFTQALSSFVIVCK